MARELVDEARPGVAFLGDDYQLMRAYRFEFGVVGKKLAIGAWQFFSQLHGASDEAIDALSDSNDLRAQDRGFHA